MSTREDIPMVVPKLDEAMVNRKAELEEGMQASGKENHSDIINITDSKISASQFWLLALTLCLGLFLSMLDTSIVATSLFGIAVEFKTLRGINWVALAYTIGALGFAVFFTQLADIMGRRDSFIAAFAMFTAFSIGCALAQNLPQLIACRALQGVGGSGLFSIAMVIFPEVTPIRMTQFVGGLCGLVIAVAGVLGPVLGGVLTRFVSWRWVFWINVPLGFVSICLFVVAWPKPGLIPDIEQKSYKEADFIGSILLIAAAVLVIFAFQNASNNPGEWGNPAFIATLIFGIGCWAILFAWERCLPGRWGLRTKPAWPSALIRNRIYMAGILTAMFIAFPFFTIVFALPLRYQLINGQSALMAGVLLLPLLGATAIGSMLGAGMSNKENRIFETALVGGFLLSVGCGLLMTLSTDGSDALETKISGFIVLVGLGNGLSAAAITILAAVESSVYDGATAQGIMAQMRLLGGSFGIAASSYNYQKMASDLGGVLASEQIGMLQHMDLTSEQLATIRIAYAKAFAEDMLVCTFISVIGLLCAFGMYRKVRPSILRVRETQILEEIARRREALTSGPSEEPS
ncbi:MFS general substrate transporter [Thozetella sp. PMI_491]|nr:MFS general substrate transporter [Thozetella sp. PMI_491]